MKHKSPAIGRLFKYKLPIKMVGDPLEVTAILADKDLTLAERWKLRAELVYAVMIAEKRQRQQRIDEINQAEIEYLDILKIQEMA